MIAVMADDTTDEAATFSTSEMVAVSGLSYRRIDYWTRIGALIPAVPAAGSGSRRRYSRIEIDVACVLARLCRVMGDSMRVEVLGRVAEVVRRSQPAWVRMDGEWISATDHPHPDGVAYFSTGLHGA